MFIHSLCGSSYGQLLLAFHEQLSEDGLGSHSLPMHLKQDRLTRLESQENRFHHFVLLFFYSFIYFLVVVVVLVLLTIVWLWPS